MVFPSVPLYLDPPTTTTWNQQQQQQVQLQQQQQQPLVITNDPLQQPQPQPQPPQHRSDVSGNMGPPRPNSTAERARLAKIPPPEQALKCPRCESTNTKFCYFNNYSLSQPRHFCKTCRRYWTRGGALRNVPVGGGCRRNKRSSSKSSASGASPSSSAASKAATASSPSAASAGPTSLPALPFGIQPLHPMMDYGGSSVPSLGLGFSGMQGMDSGGANNSMGLEQWRVSQIQQQFPFLGGMESQLQSAAAATQGMYSFDGQPTGSELITQMASVKMEDSNNTRGLNLARQYLGGGGGGVSSRTNNELQFWGGGGGGGNGGEGSSGGGGGWMTNLSGFNSSSTGSLL